MGCAASTQEDNVAPNHAHRGAAAGGLRGDRRHANTLPGAPPHSGVGLRIATYPGAMALNNRAPRAPSQDDGDNIARGGDDTPRREDGQDGGDEPQMSSPTQIRLLAKKQVSPLNGRTVCSLALVDALPRFVAPVAASTNRMSLPAIKNPEVATTDHCNSNNNVLSGRRDQGDGAEADDSVLLSVSPPCSPESHPDAHQPSRHQQHLRQQLNQLDATVGCNAPISPHLQQPTDAGQASSPLSVRSHCTRDCSICLTELAGRSVVVMACLHTFHYECAKEWLSQHDGSCPDCRTKVCVENFTFPQEIDGDAEYARREQADEDRQRLPEQGEEAQQATAGVPAEVPVAAAAPQSREASYEVGFAVADLHAAVEMARDDALVGGPSLVMA